MGKLSDRVDALEDRIDELEAETPKDILPTVGPVPVGQENTPLPTDDHETLVVKAKRRIENAEKRIEDNPGVDDLGHGSLKGNLYMQKLLYIKLIDPARHRNVMEQIRLHGYTTDTYFWP
jgi:hypothetical protein